MMAFCNSNYRFPVPLAFVLVLCFALCAIGRDACAQEQFTITTYYPAPFGSYEELRALRAAIGASYTDNHLHPFDTTGSPLSSDIPQSADLVIEGDVGIGTYQPQARLHIDTRASLADPAVLFDVTDSAGSDYIAGIDFARAGTIGAFVGIAGKGPYFQNFNIDIADTSRTDFVIASQGNLGIGGFMGTGDTDGDGYLAPIDVLLIINSLNAGTQLPAAMRRRADVTLDGQITADDATRIIQYLNDGYRYPVDNQTAPNGKASGNLQAYDVYVRNAGSWASDLGGGGGWLELNAAGQPLTQVANPVALVGTVTIPSTLSAADVPVRISWNNTPFKKIHAIILNGPSLGFPLLASQLNYAPAAVVISPSSFDFYWNYAALRFVPSYDFSFLIVGEGK